MHSPGALSHLPLSPDAGGSHAAIPRRCYASNTIMETQDGDEQRTFCSREKGRGDVSLPDILLSIISGRSRIL